MSSGQSDRNGSSVEPGLPNTFLMPNARIKSSVASLTVMAFGMVVALSRAKIVSSPGGVEIAAIALILFSTQTSGTTSGYSLLAIGLANAIMFPTIFSLACEKLGPRAADGSGIINVAIFGGAVIPLLTGVIADATGSLGAALILPAICYAIIAGFGWFARQVA